MSQESESITRRDRINKKLRALNPPWQIIAYRQGLDVRQLACHAVEEYPTASGPADYALFVRGQLLGFIEAKRLSVGAQGVLKQAKRYSKNTFNKVGNWRGYRVPFLFSSNGEIIYFIDIRRDNNTSRELKDFHSADALLELWQRDEESGDRWLRENSIDANTKLRPYQKEAIAATERALARGLRHLLIAMATGTGKTFCIVSQIYRLLESKTARRVLFLVDRRALAAQAVRTFASFDTPKGNKFDREYEVYSQKFQRADFGEDEPFNPTVLPESYLTAPNETHTFVYVSTIQRMKINLFGTEAGEEAAEETGEVPAAEDADDESDAERIDIPIHAFDLIVADECHRGYTASEVGSWRKTIDYFDAIKIGLTATPAAHTVSLFREVVYRYTTEQAVQDGWLVDWERVDINSNIRLNGTFVRAGEMVGRIDSATGEEVYDELEDEREFSTTDIERQITVPDSNRRIIEEIADYAYRHEEETGRFPKILIFAVHDVPHVSHADRVASICREVFGRGDDFVQKITGKVDRPLQCIREFRNRPEPKIAVTVDMLSTGVDIPNLEFVVFMRPVKSRILWEQMLGRGTRLCKDINKTHFKIFDCFGGSLIEYFAGASGFQIEQVRRQRVSLKKAIANIANNIERDRYVRFLGKRLHRIHRGMSQEARQMFAEYIPGGDLGELARSLPDLMENDFANTLSLLQNPPFQELLENYPRAKQPFLVAYGVEDRVSSEEVIQGKKPEDYLDSFARFIRKNGDRIEAIRILQERPEDWNVQALEELRQVLQENQFSEQQVQRATQLVHNKALVDIISAVKRAARPEEPIYTAQERVNQALARVMAGKQFKEEQLQWLGYIREHLIKNLTLEMDDFEYAPIFELHGGLGKAKKVFQGELEALIAEINREIAA